ncbi:MAG TPA: SPOR domain-containing protein [Alphaproteobacteria bacterium]|nr:SPOR domain-containing protein [Alphaproteobacteria bacterium]
MKEEDKAATRTASAADRGVFRVQLSSVKTKARAAEEASRLTDLYKPVLGSLKVEPVRADLGDRGIFYRLRAGPLADRDAAASICRKLSARNQGCLVVTR